MLVESATGRRHREPAVRRAIRQLRQDVGRENTLYIHLTLVPFIGAAGKLKTKPTQHSVRDPARLASADPAVPHRSLSGSDIKRKIALFATWTRKGDHGEGRLEHLRGPAVLADEGLTASCSTGSTCRGEARMNAWADR